MEFEMNDLGNIDKIGPCVGFFFGENELRVKTKLKSTNWWKGDVLIIFGAKILILCGLDGYKFIGNEIALHKNMTAKLLLKKVFY